MTASLLLSAYPQRVNLLSKESLSTVRFGLSGGASTIRRLSCISTSSRGVSRPDSRIHTQQQTGRSSLQQHLAPRGRPQISPIWNTPPLYRNLRTARRTASTLTKDGPSPAEGKTSSSNGKNNNKRQSKRAIIRLLSFFLLAGMAAYMYSSSQTDEDANPRDVLLEYAVGKPLNRRSFVPFTIIEREQVSPTSFIITVRPKDARDPAVARERASWLPGFMKEVHSSKGVLQRAWEYGTWSVEFKQPLLQVAREYTSLPSFYGEEEKDLEEGKLRFLIRRMEGGEVSSYLASLRVGDVVELRGPHLGFDVRRRLGFPEGITGGENRKVVFLAGGTGIAPALQVVRAVLDGELKGGRPEVRIVWANRLRADCRGCEGFETALNPGLVGNLRQGKEGVGKNAVLSFLDEARARHGDKLKYACTVDEEGEFINAKTIEGVTGMSASRPFPSGGLFYFIWGGGQTAASPDPARHGQREQDDSLDCPYHSAKRLVATDGSEDSLLSSPAKKTETTASSQNNILDDDPQNRNKDGQAKGCQCDPSHKGKNLLIVSGPDGFISTFVGPKVWANSKELQGPVRGVVGTELRKKDERFWRDWLVLKM